jgi:crossover junction endodeoxyribonuclease RusA
MGNGIMVESSLRLKPWRTDVREALAASQPVGWNREGPMGMSLDFRFTRPKSHYTASGFLTKRAPAAPVGRNTGDIDKLIRAVMDAGTTIAYNDDAQIVEVSATKVFCLKEDQPGVSICIVKLLD